MSKSGLSGAALMVAAACMALAAAEVNSGTQNSNSSPSQNANAGGGRTTSDVKFATEAAMGGMAEVELGRLAAQKGASDEVRQFGQMMVDDHTKANQELMRLASSKGMTLPTTPGAKHQAEMQKMSALSGEAFDRAYVKAMIKDHKKDVAEFQKESARGSDPDLKAFAAGTLPTLQTHLQMIQRINDKMALRKSGHLKSTNSNADGHSHANTNANSNSNR